MLSLDKQNDLREQYRRDNPSWQPATEVFAELVRENLTADSHILDIGCGRGGLVEQLTHPLSHVVGIDPDWQSLNEHRLNLPRLAGFSNTLPIKGNQFDVAYASWVLEHLQTPQADLAEISRVLKPNGVFVFITPNKRHPLIKLNRGLSHLGSIQTAMVDTLYGRESADTFPAYYKANETADLHTLASQTNLTLTTLHAIPDPTYLAFTPTLFNYFAKQENNRNPDDHLHLVGVFTKNH